MDETLNKKGEFALTRIQGKELADLYRAMIAEASTPFEAHYIAVTAERYDGRQKMIEKTLAAYKQSRRRPWWRRVLSWLKN